MNPRISVVIPVYNSEDYLHKCIKSVLSQQEHLLEILLVDDGSTDHSGNICDEYAARYSRVHVIHKVNAGVSAARNVGISVASGDYIGFVDSDDWIEPNMYERLLTEANKSGADIVMCDATTVFEDGRTQADTITQLSQNSILKKSDFTPSLLLEMAGSAWRCIYSKRIYSAKLLKSCGLQFPLGVKFSEDRIFNLYAMGRANKVCYLKESYYNRYVNRKSAVHRFHEDYFEACKKAADGIEQAIREAWADNGELQKAYLVQFISGAQMAICNYYYKTSTLTAKERREKVRVLCEDQQLRQAIEHYGTNRRRQWILNKKYKLLITYAKLTNLKNRR